MKNSTNLKRIRLNVWSKLSKEIKKKKKRKREREQEKKQKKKKKRAKAVI